jgi:hypothetical protein
VAVVAGSRKTDMAERSRVEVPADEVVPGDVVRDLGRFRRVVGVEPWVMELSLVWLFDPADGGIDRLRVASLVSVSVWRVRGDD